MNYCEHSAKQAHVHEVTPESDYVTILSNGSCVWEPRYELTVTECDIDVTWFPFDEQNCSLIFLSWLLTKDNIRILPERESQRQYEFQFREAEDWDLTGA